MSEPSKKTLDRLRACVGPKGFINPGDDQAPYLKEWRDRFVGRTALVLRPAATEEVSEIVKIAWETGTGLVPQSGNTGLVGGQIPDGVGNQVIVSTDRLNQFRELQPASKTMTVEAGCILTDIKNTADGMDLFFPLDLASAGSARIGGLLSTNAGGTTVLKYGNARDLVLGLEVVLPNGNIWEGLNHLRKNNTGYDLKHLFMGAEGTLGIITAATLKLFPKPKSLSTVFVGLNSTQACVDLLILAKQVCGEEVRGFEFLNSFGMQTVLKHGPKASAPLSQASNWYVLIECASMSDEAELRARMENFLAPALEQGIIKDAVIATNETQAANLWALRENLSEAQKGEGGSIKNDVSVAVKDVPAFIEEANRRVDTICPGIRPCPFGHLGDGNVHYNLSQPVGADKATFLAQWPEITDAVNDLVAEFGGSFSAEHGIGQLKRDELVRYKSSVEMDLMRQLKATLDPKGIMNPGKML